jgi:MOB kinase activator 1
MHVVDLYNETSLLFSTIMDKCTDTRCPKMNAGKKFEYLWADQETKKPMKVSAPKYVDLLMTWIEEQLNDESIFPTRVDTPFPKNFRQIVAKIMQRLFRVYSHIYHEHFRDILALNAPAHLNSAFKRFVLFTREFKLLSKRDYAPLQDLIDKKLDNKGLKKRPGMAGKKKVQSVGVPKYMLSAKQPIVSPHKKDTSLDREPVAAPKPPTEEEVDDEKSGGMCVVM